MTDTGGPRKSGKKRVRKFTSDDRAAHRLFEKARREAFKEKLNEFAGHLPTLADSDPQRLSKHIVVEEGIARCQTLQQRCLDALGDIRALIRERDELLTEVNARRHVEGTPLKMPQANDLHVDGLLEVENESKHPVAAQQLELGQVQGCSTDETQIEGRDHGRDDRDTITTPLGVPEELAPATQLSVPQPPVVPPLPAPEISGSYVNPPPLGSMCLPQDPASISELLQPGTFPMSFNASLDFLDIENTLLDQELTLYDVDTMPFHLEPGASDMQSGGALALGYLGENVTS
ncbi:hypothetical protein FZEAL_10059 [Fusarium zealandicum]|uniref:BHLH domain-containing protein n=1 Tax=Fusarium zealandicum TaxID=1053134 RepID=A0A8H4XCV7_9HYPO|nr:hypothetical protein FZEAL_10059 [Fusarium zealandicum]